MSATGFFVPRYYAAQTAVGFGNDAAAARHYLASGRDEGVLPNPVHDFVHAPLPGTEDILSAHFASTIATYPTREGFDATAYLRQFPSAEGHPGGPAGHFLEAVAAGPSTFTLDTADGKARNWANLLNYSERCGALLPPLDPVGIFDREYYEAQVRHAFASDIAARWHYLEIGEHAGLSPHPLFEPRWFARSSNAGGRLLFPHFLRGGALTSTSPQFDTEAYVDEHSEAATQPLVHYMANLSAGSRTFPTDGRQSVLYAALRERLMTLAPSAVHAPASVAVLVRMHQDWGWSIRVVDTILDLAGDPDIEVVLVDDEARGHALPLLAARYAGDDRVRCVLLDGVRSWPERFRTIASTSSGTIVVLDSKARPLAGWLEPLISGLGDPGVLGVQALIEAPDGAIHSAGQIFDRPESLPTSFLAGHPREDAESGIDLAFPAADLSCLAVRAELAAAVGLDPGIDPALQGTDFCLRAVERFGGRFQTATAARVMLRPSTVTAPPLDATSFLLRWSGRLPVTSTDRYRPLGLEVGGGALVRRSRTVASGPAAGLPCLRWALKLPMGAGPIGDVWGDTFFAQDLAAALRTYGQEVVQDRRDAHHRPHSHLDDVTLNIRGRRTYAAGPDETSILWVISHPDEVTDEELGGYDLTFGASTTWSRKTSARTGHQVTPLLQATNAARFRPDGVSLDGNDVLFVGRPRAPHGRPIIDAAIAVDAPLSIYGEGWEKFVDASHIRAAYLPNDELPAAYRGARIVLNDHWADMATQGFYSNRLFDAVACGARVVSDPVNGVEELFGGSVQVYENLDDLRRLISDGITSWPSPAQLRHNAREVARNHSFEARARTLLAAVLEHRGIAHALTD